MRGFENQETQVSAENKLEEFNQWFNRLYATQQYMDAFAFCTKHLKCAYKEDVKKKAEMVVPKLTSKLEIQYEKDYVEFEKTFDWSIIYKYEVTQDTVIDILASLGYKMKMKDDDKTIKVSSAFINVENKYTKTVITSRANIIKILLVFIVLFFLNVALYILDLCNIFYFDNFDNFDILMSTSVIGLVVVYRLWSKHKILIRKIATEVIKFKMK